MSVTVLDVSGAMKRQVEPLLERIFESSDIGDLTLSRTCAHVMLESVRLLGDKESQESILSSTTFFLIALLIARRLADEEPAGLDADLGGELARLQNWGAILAGEHGARIDQMVASFFRAKPVPAKDEFERLPEERALAGVKPGPGLEATLRAAAGSGAITAPDLLLNLVESDRTALAGRLLDDRRLVDALRDASAARRGRHTRMIREAEPEELALGVADYAVALATVLRAAEGEFTLALFGPWGSGKTTLVEVLKRFLEQPKEYQAATSVSGQFFAEQSYRVVVHNAWKYRSRPEAWVYAYKSLATKASAGFDPLGRLLLSIRTSIYRRGVWPIVCALLTLAVLAVPLTAKLQLVVLAASVVGFSAILYLAAVVTSVSGRVRALFAKHLRLAPGDERLGMLALIGDDVKALIRAWTLPRPGLSGDGAGDELSWGRLAVPILLLSIVALLWGAGLVGSGATAVRDLDSGGLGEVLPPSWAATIETLRSRPGGLATVAEWLVFGFWCLLVAAMIPLSLLAWWGRPHRVLMVIDDLDRCSAEEMLDVIEGMRLLVDDSAINNRLQVLMLVDEAVLDHAIALRYKSMIGERAAETGGVRDEAQTAARTEVVIEQHEKLFACHLRLASLGDSDVAALVTSLASRELEEKRRERRERDLQRLQRQRDAASAAFRAADETARRAEADYGSVEFAAPKELPDHLRMRTASGTLMPSDIEARYAHDSWASLSPEERLERRPEVVEARDKARKARESAEARVRALSLVSASDESPATTDPLFDQSDVRFTAVEVDELRLFVPAYLREIGRRPSPRAVRMLLFKVQLCRLLLQLRYPGQPAVMRSIQAILDAFAAAVEPDRPAVAESEIVAIARQVI